VGIIKGKDTEKAKDKASDRAQYMTEVHKGSINMSKLADQLNERYEEGWELHSIFEQDGNGVTVYQRRA
jgi:hypothetical protein